MECVVVYTEPESNSIRTVKGKLISKDEFFITVKDGYGNTYEISRKTVLKIKYKGDGNHV